MIKSFCEEIMKEKIRNNKGKMSIRRIYMSGSTRVHKCSRRLNMAPDDELFIYEYVYASVKHMRDVC